MSYSYTSRLYQEKEIRHAMKQGEKRNDNVPRVIFIDKYTSLLPVHQRESQLALLVLAHSMKHEDLERMIALGYRALMEEV